MYVKWKCYNNSCNSDASDLLIKTNFNAKVTKIQNKIPNTNRFVTKANVDADVTDK